MVTIAMVSHICQFVLLVGTVGVNFHGFTGNSIFVEFQKPSSDATFAILNLRKKCYGENTSIMTMNTL